MNIQPYYVVPVMVEQPTWGGSYISGFKNISETEVTSKNIGQSFELASDSVLTPNLGSTPAFGLASASDIAHPVWFHKPDSVLSIVELISDNPAAVLGQRFLDAYGSELKILIKFTQAQNNSYQVHVRPGEEFGQWLAKPESWYFLEAGKATLGLAQGVDINEYQSRAQAIDAFAQGVSHKIKSGILTLEAGKKMLAEFINTDHPRRFVNTVTIQANQVVDMSGGGIHHSWEVGPEAPIGNIVYEVQVDVRDERCTLRSFDQGSIKADGSVRPLTIQDYFKAMDTDPKNNVPDQYLSSPLTDITTHSSTTLFANQYYQTQLLNLKAAIPEEQETNGAFHHLFAQTGEVNVSTVRGTWKLPKGWSLFIPAGVEKYSLTSNTTTQVLLTTL